MSTDSTNTLAKRLDERLSRRKATLGVIGLGYVGLPLAIACHNAGFSVIGFDVRQELADTLNSGRSNLKTVPHERIAKMRADNRFEATTDYDRLREVDAVMICVPTPLSKHRDPDLSFIESTGRSIAPRLKPGQLVVLESTTYPGTTNEVLKPILEQSGLRAGKDFFLAYSPEREDPGNPDFETNTIPRVVGGDDPITANLARALYSQIIEKVIPVSSCATAEAVKITENIFRAVNIALVNELKIIYAKMGIDIWEVVDAAKSKPFGYMPFYPGPGIGGHCIPIDPFYLTWKAREFEVPTRFIELAGEVNEEAPTYVIDVLIEALSRRLQKSLNGSRILLLGLAYKKNVDDMRESPSLRIYEMLEKRGAKVDYFDPNIPVVPATREHASLTGKTCVSWNKETLSSYDAALICTDHDDVDYEQLASWLPLVVDTRNATRGVKTNRDRLVAG